MVIISGVIISQFCHQGCSESITSMVEGCTVTWNYGNTYGHCRHEYMNNVLVSRYLVSRILCIVYVYAVYVYDGPLLRMRAFRTDPPTEISAIR